MSKQLYAAALAVMLAVVSSAWAGPACTTSTGSGGTLITIADTGMVYQKTRGHTPPAGLVTYPGTGRPGDDVTVSCKDNQAACTSARWYLRFADAKQGWPGDEVIDSDTRVVKCSYNPTKLAQSCTVPPATDGMLTTGGKRALRLHFSAKDSAGTVIAAYQPQQGCIVQPDAEGNPHTILPVSQRDRQ